MDRSPSARSRLTWLLIALGVVVSSTMWTGCSPQKHYKLLSFFFDGVPDPSQAGVGAGRRGQPIGGQPMLVFTHKPFAEEKCDVCHKGGVNTLFRPLPQSISANICITCHKETDQKYPIMHGPVANIECLWCHAPHEANFKHLLKYNSPEVCLQCHTPELLSPEPPEHMNPSIDCLQCHSGHGGQEHGLLKPGYTARAPSSAPAAPSGGPP
jgi:predicted CXXCH cytochrome family protein